MNRKQIINELRARGILFNEQATTEQLNALLNERNLQVPPLQLRAMLEPGTFDEQARTIEVTFATPTEVVTRDYNSGSIFIEQLSFEPNHVRLERLNAGAPILDNHNRWGGVRGVLGAVQKAWLDGNKGRAIIKLSGREDMAGVIQDIKDGILRTVSAGYRVYKYQKIKEGDVSKGTPPTMRAIDWEPFEISFAPIPADIKSTVREGGTELNNCIIVEPNTTNQMNREQIINDLRTRGIQFDEQATTEELSALLARSITTPPAGTQPVAQPGVTDEQVRAAATAAVTAERQRTADIMTAVRSARLSDDFAQTLIANGTPIEKARELIIAEFAKADPAAQTRNNVTVTRDEQVTQRNAMEDSLLLRCDPAGFAIPATEKERTESVRQFRGFSLLDLARQMLEMGGVSTRGLSRDEIVSRALTTSDYPILLANVVNKVLRRAYEGGPQTWRPLSRQMNASDFKEMSALQFGGNMKLEKVTESGEFKQGKMAEAKESWNVETYGKIVSISRQAIINDDLNGFARVSQLFGAAAANLESDIMWGLITKNVKMSDGKAIFDAAHKNLVAVNAGAAPSTTTLSAARLALRKQTGLEAELLNLQMKYLIVPPELETVAEQLMNNRYMPTEQDKINVFASALQIISEARLTDTKAWYMTADPSQIDMLVHSYLDGQEGLYTETRYGFEVDGVQIKVRKDFGGGVMDYRGMYKNAGV